MTPLITRGPGMPRKKRSGRDGSMCSNMPSLSQGAFGRMALTTGVSFCAGLGHSPEPDEQHGST